MYATEAELLSRIPPGLVPKLGDGAVDSGAIVVALTDASAKMDAMKVDVGMPNLVAVCCDIAAYRLASTVDLLSDIIKERYDAAVDELQELGGRSSIADAASAGDVVEIEAAKKVWARR